MAAPMILTMLSKQGIEGDDTLLRLAQTRLQEAGLGGELYPDSPEQLRQQLAYRPAGRPCTVHLPRDINLLRPEGLARVLSFAAWAAGNVYGMVVHDHRQFADAPEQTIDALRAADRALADLPHAPLLFVEYAVGLTPDFFASLFERTADLPRVCCCIDVSHVGIEVCRTAYRQRVADVDICALKTATDLAAHMDGIQAATAEALPAVLRLIERIARLGKPLHFHLHDGHPLSTLSRYGVSDHLSFLQEVRLPFVHHERALVEGMFGPAGLRAIVRTTLATLPAERVSFMIEVHPQEGRIPLGVHAGLFRHWKEAVHAERMNYWLETLLHNARLVRAACAESATDG